MISSWICILGRKMPGEPFDSSTKSSMDSSGKALAESSAKPLAVRTMVSNAKFEVEKFDGTNNFRMWQCEVMDV